MIQTQPIEERYSSWKRIFIFVLDALLVFVLALTLLLTVGTITIKGIAKNDINVMNENYIALCEQKGYTYEEEGLYGLMTLDRTDFMDKLIEEGKTATEAYEEYEKERTAIQTDLDKIDVYSDASARFAGVYILTLVVSFFIPLFIFQFLFPLFTKKRQTPFMMAFKVSIVNSKDNTLVSGLKLLLRFFFIFVVEFLAVYLVIDLIGELFVILITFVSISLTKKTSALHDLALRTRVIPKDKAYTRVETIEA